MLQLSAALRAVLADIAALGKQGNAALVGALAAGIVAVAAAVFGVTLTIAEVSGWIALVAVIAATVEKAIGQPAPPAPAPPTPPAPPAPPAAKS